MLMKWIIKHSRQDQILELYSKIKNGDKQIECTCPKKIFSICAICRKMMTTRKERNRSRYLDCPCRIASPETIMKRASEFLL
ncbi:MAG: hypothetical protein ACFFDN_50920 [Candidatus Hodarchaeota archaeon]